MIAITFHEAAHGFVAHRLGDNTAWQLGRVSFNPLKHIDPFGTLIAAGHPAAVAFAVPVRLRQAGAGEFPAICAIPGSTWSGWRWPGPATNIVLALAGGGSRSISLPFVPANAAQWTADNLKNALPDQCRAGDLQHAADPAAGRRPGRGRAAAATCWLCPLSRLEPYGMLILIGLLILLPIIGSQLGLNLDVISAILRTLTGYVIRAASLRHRQRVIP